MASSGVRSRSVRFGGRGFVCDEEEEDAANSCVVISIGENDDLG